jgi:2'-5' RNA ligase
VDPKNLHLTLKFIGESYDLQGITKALSEVRGAPAEVGLKGLGTFPRVLWIGVQADLASLAARIDQALEPLGITRETRPFSPHLTIARMKDGRMPKFNEQPDFGSFRISEFVLYESKLGSSGPTYTALERFPLC